MNEKTKEVIFDIYDELKSPEGIRNSIFDNMIIILFFLQNPVLF